MAATRHRPADCRGVPAHKNSGTAIRHPHRAGEAPHEPPARIAAGIDTKPPLPDDNAVCQGGIEVQSVLVATTGSIGWGDSAPRSTDRERGYPPRLPVQAAADEGEAPACRAPERSMAARSAFLLGTCQNATKLVARSFYIATNTRLDFLHIVVFQRIDNLFVPVITMRQVANPLI